MSSRQAATGKWFDPQRGIGYLTDLSGVDIFVHYTGIVSDEKFAILKAGQQVEFTPAQTDRGYQAKQCEVIV